MKESFNPFKLIKANQIRVPDKQTPSLYGEAKRLSLCSSPEGRELLPYELATRLNVLPLTILTCQNREILLLAAETDSDYQLLNTLRFATGKEIKLVQTAQETLNQAIFIAYHRDQALLENQIKSLSLALNSQTRSISALPDIPFEGSLGSPAMLLATLIKYCVAEQASDLHLIPTATGTQIKLRINGEIQQYSQIVGNRNSHEQLINRIKVLAQMDTVQRRIPLDGTVQLDIGGELLSLRASIIPTIHGQKAVLRLIGCQSLLSLENLRLHPQCRFFLDRYLEKAQGAVLFAGATGSGKTTTMYALLEKFNARNLNIVTIEDPVEIRLAGVSQTSLDATVDLDYATCLRSVLRQDPDVILLGEIRDHESAVAALQAALTGHALLSTVHARNVFEVFLRLHNLQIDRLTLAQAVQLVVCQKLLPELCANCKRSDLQASKILKREVFRAVGCSYCDQSGFSGRVLATEMLWLDSKIAEVLASQSLQLTNLRELATASCYHPIDLSLQSLLQIGAISAEQYLNNRQP